MRYLKNVFLKYEPIVWRRRHVLTNIWGGGASNQIPFLSNAGFTAADLFLVGEVHHQPPTASSQWRKVQPAHILEVRKIRRELTSALLFDPLCVEKWAKYFYSEKRVLTGAQLMGGAELSTTLSLTIYRNVWNIHNRRILKFTVLLKFKTTHKG